MTLRELQTLLDYHYWARDRVLEAAERLTPAQFTQPMGGSFACVRDTLVHTYSADWVWHARWTGESPTGMLDPGRFADVGAIRAAWQDLEGQVRTLVARFGDAGIQRAVEYRSFDGRPNAQAGGGRDQSLDEPVMIVGQHNQA